LIFVGSKVAYTLGHNVLGRYSLSVRLFLHLGNIPNHIIVGGRIAITPIRISWKKTGIDLVINKNAANKGNIEKNKSSESLETTLKITETTKNPLTDKKFNQCLPNRFIFLPQKNRKAAGPITPLIISILIIIIATHSGVSLLIPKALEIYPHPQSGTIPKRPRKLATI